MSEFVHVYVVFRVDFFLLEVRDLTEGNADDVIRMKNVFRSADEAKKEVDRLNALNRDKGCFYYWQSAKVDLSFFE